MNTFEDFRALKKITSSARINSHAVILSVGRVMQFTVLDDKMTKEPRMVSRGDCDLRLGG